MAKIFRVSVRAGMTRVVEPIARALLRVGVSPNAVTVAGTVGVLIGAIGFGARGQFLAGVVIVTLSALTDLLDGTMARLSGGTSRFGAFLDSSMDRVADAAIFGAVTYWLAVNGDRWGAVAGLICLTAGQIVSYVKARAEGLGLTCNVGLAERPERLITVGVGGLLSGLGLSWGLPAALWVLAVLSVITVGQRIAHVYRQDRRSRPGRAGVNPEDLGYAAAWRLVRALPLPVARAAFRAGADCAYRKGGKGTGRLADNLRRVVGPQLPKEEFDALVRRGLRSYARYWMEMFRLPSLSREQILCGFRLERGHLLGEDVAAGRGAVVALPHAGNWDAAGAWVAAMGWPMTTVAERLKPEGVYERFLAFRRGLGMEIIPLTGGPQPPLDVLADRISKGHVVPLLADRDLSARGVDVEFFGARTRMPPGPALLALRTGAPLYVVSMWYEHDAACGRLEGPLEVPGPETGPLDQRVRVLTQQVADRLAAGIAQHPEDWHMMQRMWLADGADRTGSAAAARPPSSTDRV